jgi:beta-carotene ketolase (CrtO type)
VYDVIVAGGGHHGLTCAAYLAREGRRVIVLEREGWLGGMSYSRETVVDAPGFTMNPCAVDLLFTNLKPSIVDELGLESFGLRQISPDPWGAYVGPAGESIGLWRSLERTVGEIRRYSCRDAARFAEMCELWCDFWYTASPYLMDHPTRPHPRTVAELARRAIKKRRSLAPVSRMLLNSPYQVIEEMFESEQVKSLLAVYAAGSNAPLREPGSGAVLGVIMLHIGWGIKRPVGGMGNFTEALAGCVRHHGGETRVDAKVEEVLVRDDGRVYGVRLVSGEEIHGKHVVGALDPVRLIDLVDPQFIPTKLKDELRMIRINGWGVGSAKIDVALRARPELLCQRPELWGSYMLVGPSVDYTNRAIDAAMRGEFAEEVPMWALMPSAADRSQVPDGNDGDTMYLFCPSVPHTLSGHRDWADHRQTFGDHALEVFNQFAPGTTDAVIGHWVKGPRELEHMAHGGSYVTVDMSLNQMGPNRPVPSMSGYKTPVDGLWHTGSGAHPMAGVHGWNGRTTARTVEKVLQKDPSPVVVPYRTTTRAATTG